jgi:hypothetical protein
MSIDSYHWGRSIVGHYVKGVQRLTEQYRWKHRNFGMSAQTAMSRWQFLQRNLAPTDMCPSKESNPQSAHQSVLSCSNRVLHGRYLAL